MTRPYPARSASLAITLLGSLTNLILALQLAAAWRVLKWEPESEWESSGWRFNGIKIVLGLLSSYFAITAALCAVGFWGSLKNKSAYVRIYRDYSIVDFSFCTFFTLVGTYTALRPFVRTGVCEELSRQPEFMRDMAEMGLNLENCELWFERAVLVVVAVMFITIIIRLHFLIAISNFYSHLSRYHQRSCSLPTHCHSLSLSHSHSHGHSRTRSTSRSQDSQRILLLSRLTTFTFPSSVVSGPPPAAPQTSFSAPPTPSSGGVESPTDDNILVYAPIPLSMLSPQQAQELRANATEAWVSRSENDHDRARGHRHRYPHQHTHHSVDPTRAQNAGRISLPIRENEPLLPGYDDVKA
ncbi:hypothetical protein BDN71DRAFT_1443174 [Pleurotus eryngii]|uniref:Uncharacterized protein n=1 Tax=Pleurotus eryngii TaxID=5323 RepID=A0A9P6DID2_PLEER|nr:hypothetical protein BDN71DRAFT_1443174 [Pleurotus eryngii]